MCIRDRIHNASNGGDTSFDLALTASTGGVVPPPPANDPNPIPFGSAWSYLDDGSQPAANWIQTGFNAAGWPVSNAEFGARDGDESTVVDNGPRGVFFRRSFDVNDPAAVASFELDLIRDDGAAVYVNGVEVLRDNLPAGPLTVNTWATAAVYGSAENTPTTWSIDPGVLIAGSNTIAVQVHNASNNGDLSFDLSLRLS